MLPGVVVNGADVVVRGHDDFGTPFSEKTQVRNHCRHRFSLALPRRIPQGASLVIEFQPEPRRTVWATVAVIAVRSDVEGWQTIEVQASPSGRSVASRTATQV